MQKPALLLGLLLAGASPAFAAFIGGQPADGAVYQAAAAVAEGDCGLDLPQWVDLVVSLGGSEAEAIFAVNEMKRAGEVELDQQAQTIKLKGVLGCP